MKRAVPLARHEPQTQCFSGFLDRADDRHVSIPCLQHCEGALPDSRTPSSAAPRADTTRAEQTNSIPSMLVKASATVSVSRRRYRFSTSTTPSETAFQKR